MITLRPYQREAKRALAEHLGAMSTNPCIVLPTGSGKSLVIASCLSDWVSEYSKFRCIVLAHRRELVQQNYDESMSNVRGMRDIPQCEVGVFCSALKRRDYDAQLTFASIDSVYRKAGEFPPFDCILVDEAHRIPPKGEGKYLTFLNGCRRWNNKLVVVGLTATPFRMGSGPLCHKDHLLQEVCYGVGVSDLIDEGYLCKLRSKVGKSIADLSEVKKRGGEYAIASLSKATNRANLVEKAVGEIIAILAREKRKSVLIFCVDVEHCNMVSQELARYGIRAPAMTGKTPHRERDRIGNDFKDGRLCCVCNVNVYTEGF
ncbi:MAG: DEAD/DEAH box helicase, partial [Deltaproteobacteria bacterium]|nr:DEAD/DEAH box helicase [Deltaproteobacteria bacterium]